MDRSRLWTLVVVLLVGALSLVVRLQVHTFAAPHQAVTRTFPAGYNIISAPPGTDVSAAAGLFTLQPGDSDYRTTDPSAGTTSGFGYWAYFTDSTTVTLSAGLQSPYTVMAQPARYFLIGNPSGTMPATVSGASAVFTFQSGNYQMTTTLQPGDGAWAISLGGGPVTVTPGGTQPSSTPAPATPAAGASAASALLTTYNGTGYSILIPTGWKPVTIPANAKNVDVIIKSPDGKQEIEVDILPNSGAASADLAVNFTVALLKTFSMFTGINNLTVTAQPAPVQNPAGAAALARADATYSDADGQHVLTLLTAVKGSNVYSVQIEPTVDYFAGNVGLFSAITASFQVN